MKRVMMAAAAFAALGGGVVLAQPEPEEHVVEMVLEDGKYRFEPATVEARAGDRVTFVNVSGGPHNIAFEADSVPAGSRAALSAMLTDRIAELSGPLLTDEGARYTIVVEGLGPGRYPFVCLPHIAMDMRGTLVVVE